MIKLSKILRILAAAAFLTALAVNVKVSLTDPFVGMSKEAIATGTSEPVSSGTTTCPACPGDSWVECDFDCSCGEENVQGCLWTTDPNDGSECTPSACPSCGKCMSCATSIGG
jgi:hypothetical protein